MLFSAKARNLTAGILLVASILIMPMLEGADSFEGFEDQVTHHYAKNGETSIHYTSLGEGPLLVMIHGFPDYWYSWRHQMKSLSSHYQTVAIDQRGYNLSDKPEGINQYKIEHLVEDVKAVILHSKKDNDVYP